MVLQGVLRGVEAGAIASDRVFALHAAHLVWTWIQSHMVSGTCQKWFLITEPEITQQRTVRCGTKYPLPHSLQGVIFIKEPVLSGMAPKKIICLLAYESETFCLTFLFLCHTDYAQSLMLADLEPYSMPGMKRISPVQGKHSTHCDIYARSVFSLNPQHFYRTRIHIQEWNLICVRSVGNA